MTRKENHRPTYDKTKKSS